MTTLFNQYSELEIEAERRFLQFFDPYFFVRALLQFQTPLGTEFLDELFEQDDDAEYRDYLTDHVERFEATRSAAARYFRYLNSETFVVLVCSGHPTGPTPKALSHLYPAELETVFQQLALAKVPETPFFKGKKLPTGFEEWFALNIALGAQFPELSEYRELFVAEANLLANRQVVSSFKHGRALQPVVGDAWKITRLGSDESIMQPMTSAVQWIHMPKGRKQEEKKLLEHGFEETDFRSDLKAVVQVAHVMDLIRKMRLQLLNGSMELDVFLPRVVKSSQKPQRVVVKVTS
ncbi:hypothetical protein RA19_13220 [Leisingera sp. ANG-M1]|uniref:hypothetical protein n=1 Tax=Leisingera sp. ANG-M1 TaxID=1577895 RepID=UPI00057FA843|nr:hypothetical protein [Leisingera sp. ANG-M1]KIC10103.1 hypothetical protein RA19_13220 [Leisingera sp. ANG-M1]